MPRRNPLPQQEIEICRRVRDFRQSEGIARTVFSKKAGLDDAALVRIEHFRQPLRYDIYMAIHREFAINPLWLRTEEGLKKTGFLIEDSQYASQIKPNDLFSEVYDRFLFMEMLVTANENRRGVHHLIADMGIMANEARAGRFVDLPEDALKEIVSASGDLQKEFTQLLVRSSLTRGSGRKKMSLTNVTGIDNNPSVKPQLPNLLERLKKATAERGKKSSLAKFLDVPLANVSQWLSGVREPGGETTLRMLHWVELQERK